MNFAHRICLIVAGVAALATASLALPPAAYAASRTPVAPAHVIGVPRLPAGARLLNKVASDQHLIAGIYLEPRSPGALSRFAAAVSNVHSRQFRHYLARGQFASRFGPTSSTVRRVESVLRDEGLTVVGASSNRLEVTVVGTASRFEHTFATSLSNVRLASGAIRQTTTRPIVVPSSIARYVQDVVGLDDMSVPSPLTKPVNQLRRPTERGKGHYFTRRPAFIAGAPSACTDAQAATEEGFGGITDDQVASAYGVDGLYKASDFGAGQTVAIFEMEPFLLSDVATFDKCYFGASHTSQITVTNVDGGPGTGPGSGEAALDVENVSAIAPGAKIDVYEAPETTYGWIDNYNQIVAADTAQEISTSWGFCEQGFLSTTPAQLTTESMIFEQAAAQGQTVFAASGDLGNDGCGNEPPETPLTSVDDPASQQYVVGVGGTTAINTDQPPAQQVWNDGAFGGAGGGGISAVWTMPPWQRPLAKTLSNTSTCNAPAGQLCRTVPDVTGFADEYTGITIYYDGEWITIGGTSSSAPLWAGMLAEINASSTCKADVSTANGVGFAAPLLYDVAANSSDYATDFTDVTQGNNDILNDTHQAYKALTGYDLASGLGSPELTTASDGPALAAGLCGAAQDGTTATVTSVSPSSGAVGGGTAFTLMGTGFKPGGTSDVQSVDFGTSPATSIDVVSNTELTGTTTGDSATTNGKLNALTSKTGSVLVTVTTDDGSVALGPTYHYVDESAGKTVPVVYQVGPIGGKASGGTMVSIYGTGFLGATAVTFGGKAATSFTIKSDTLIIAKAPSDSGASCRAGDAADQGLCQTEVQVTGPGGKSPTVALKKPYAGELEFNELGEITAPPGCNCEAYPAVTEYDYVTKLSLSTVIGPDGTAYEPDPYGGDVIDLIGKGFNVLTLDWVDIGVPTQQASEDDFILSVNGAGTSIEFFSFGDPHPEDVTNAAQVSVRVVSGQSNAKSLSFGPVQQVNSLSTDVLSTSGGTSFVIHGGGFVNVSEVVFSPDNFNDPPVYVLGNFTVNSTTEITLPSPSLIPGAYEVFVCGRYTCGTGIGTYQAAYTVVANYPGEIAVTSDEVPGTTTSPSGPVAGGTTFEVQGANFGPVADLTAYFYNIYGEYVTSTTVVSYGPTTDPGATDSVKVTSPAALGGFPDTDYVVLVSSNPAYGSSPENSSALFTYNS